MGQMSLFVEYIAPSTNAMYAGQHWSKRKAHKAAAEAAVMVALMQTGKQVFTKPVKIQMQPNLGKGKRGYDVSNYSYTFKLIEDCLVSRGILKADTADFVKEVRFMSPVRADKTGMVILISEAE